MDATSIIASGGLPDEGYQKKPVRLGRTARGFVLIAALTLGIGAVAFDREVLRIACGAGALLFVAVLSGRFSRPAVPINRDLDPGKFYASNEPS